MNAPTKKTSFLLEISITVAERTSITVTQSAADGYELKASIRERRLAPGEAWDMDLTVLHNGEVCDDLYGFEAYFQYAGDDGQHFTMHVQMPAYISWAPVSTVSELAPAGLYDLVVWYTNYRVNPAETYSWVIEDFMTVIDEAVTPG